MKVLWIVLGVLFGLCLICAGGGYWLFSKGKAAYDEAVKFGDDSFRAVATNWSPEELQRLAPAISKEQVESVTAKCSKGLGPLKGEFKSALTSFNGNNDNGVSSIRATWQADPTFEKGSGHVELQLLKRGEKWEIVSIDVQSPQLTSQPGQGTSSSNEGETKPDEPNVPAGTTG